MRHEWNSGPAPSLHRENIGELQQLGFSACIIREIENDEARRHGGSEIEVAGMVWRKRHGFGRPYMKLGGRGSGGGYRAQRDAAELARKRKTQKASRVRNKIANGIRSAGVMFGKAMMLARKAGRGQ